MNLCTRLLYFIRHCARPRNVAQRRAELLHNDNQTELQRRRFFDVVSEDALFGLVRFLSNEPHSEQWLQTVDPKCVQAVLRVGGALGAVSREMFKSLDSCDIRYGCFRDRSSLITLMAPYLECLALWVPLDHSGDYERLCSLRVLRLFNCDDANVLEQILKPCGDSLIELNISNSSINERMV